MDRAGGHSSGPRTSPGRARGRTGSRIRGPRAPTIRARRSSPCSSASAKSAARGRGSSRSPRALSRTSCSSSQRTRRPATASAATMTSRAPSPCTSLSPSATGAPARGAASSTAGRGGHGSGARPYPSTPAAGAATPTAIPRPAAAPPSSRPVTPARGPPGAAGKACRPSLGLGSPYLAICPNSLIAAILVLHPLTFRLRTSSFRSLSSPTMQYQPSQHSAFSGSSLNLQNRS